MLQMSLYSLASHRELPLRRHTLAGLDPTLRNFALLTSRPPSQPRQSLPPVPLYRVELPFLPSFMAAMSTDRKVFYCAVDETALTTNISEIKKWTTHGAIDLIVPLYSELPRQSLL